VSNLIVIIVAIELQKPNRNERLPEQVTDDCFVTINIYFVLKDIISTVDPLFNCKYS
jgi:hypothetical protein